MAAGGGLDPPGFGRALARPGQGRLPVTVLTGFLGAGKSTLIRRFLDTEAGAGTALIVNEFGEIGIDDALLRASSARTTLLGNGCLCCSARSDLQQALRDLFAERASGAVPNFRRVLVETTGLADPTPLLQMLSADRMLGLHYAFTALVTAVDAAAALETADAAPEWDKQVALADRVILTKGDLVDPARRGAVLARIGRSNPQAEVVEARQGEVDPAAITEASSRTLLGWRGEAVADDASGHLSPYTSFVLAIEAPLPWSAFRAALRTLTELRGPDLLRVKGYVNVEGRRGPVVVHIVQHLEHPPEELTAWPDEDRRTRLVFVTRGLDRERVGALLGLVAGLTVAPGA